MFSFTKSKEEEKIDDIYIGDLFEHEIENENNNDFENESKLENESENESEFENESENDNENEIENESEDDREFNSEFEDDSDYEDDSEYEDYSENEDDKSYKDVEFRLIPFIFTEKYTQIKGSIKDSYISCFSFLNVLNNGIISDSEFKEIENRIKYRLAGIFYTDTWNIKVELDKYNDSCFVFNCSLTIYREKFKKLIDNGNQTVKYTIEKFKELRGFDRDVDYFKYLTEFLELYLKNIYGYHSDIYSFCPYNNNISKIIEKDYTISGINPFIYSENVISFREIRTKSKDVKKTNTIIETTIMKLGFVFDYVIAR